jgi:phosphatidylserine decarboxylase
MVPRRNCLLIRTASVAEIGIVQIARLVSRRIVPFVRPGTSVGADERIGTIRFGSREPRGSSPQE